MGVHTYHTFNFDEVFMNYCIAVSLSAALPLFDEVICAASTFDGVKDEILSFVCQHPDRDFSNGFNVTSYVNDFLVNTVHLSYDPLEDTLLED